MLTLTTTPLIDRLRDVKADIETWQRIRQDRIDRCENPELVCVFRARHLDHCNRERPMLDDIQAIIGDESGIQLAQFDAWLRNHLPDRASRIVLSELGSALKAYRAGESGPHVGMLHRAVWDCEDHLDKPDAPETADTE